MTAFAPGKQPKKGFDLKVFEKTLALIPEGVISYGPNDEEVTDNSTSKRCVIIDSFYISKFEVSNGQYLVFLEALRQHDTMRYRSMLPDTLVWRAKLAFNEPYVEYYLRHPAYSNYPVVGVSYEQAQAYCSWLTQTYMHEPKRKFEKINFHLPTNSQWILAAQGKLALSPFPWKGTKMMDEKGKARANFLFLDQANIARAPVCTTAAGTQGTQQLYYAGGSAGNSNGDITAPVDAFQPNSYGLYNMAGNVEEFVLEKGSTHGGSWHDPGYYLQNFVSESYNTLNSASSERGFRFVMEVEK